MPVEVVGIHHISLLVSDIQRATAFYESALGLQRTGDQPFGSKVVWYALGEWQQLHVITSAAVPDRHEGHPAFEVRDIRAAVESCLAAGATLQQDVFVRKHDDSLSAFVRDPDLNLLELTQHSLIGEG